MTRWQQGRRRAVLGVAVALLVTCSRQDGEARMEKAPGVVRQARGAGRWFPARAAELRALVTGALEDAKPVDIPGRVVAVVAPHAGYVYSGGVAGAAFRALRDNAEREGAPETVVVLGFSHRRAFSGVALLDGDALETPLGRARLDTDAAAFLVQHGRGVHPDAAVHDGEHSAENEVPFVQVALPGAKLVVLLVSSEPRTLEDLAAALAELAKTKRIAVVASSDMLHDPDWEWVTRTDRQTLNLLEALDLVDLQAQWSPDHQVLCGINPVTVALRFAQRLGATRGTVLQYRNSGDDHPESRGQWVVGYGAVAFAAAP